MRYTVTVIGGGTGSFSVLSGLKNRDELSIQSIVTMMDSGGDSGRLRDEFGVLPPGDARRCLIALSEESQLLRDLLDFRFNDAPLEDRNLGNLILLALTKQLGSERRAIDAFGRLLKIKGQVIAVTWTRTHLFAELADGTLIRGEANISVPKHDASIPIARVFLKPQAAANPAALEAIERSDFIVLAPGDLFTSTVPNLLVRDIPRALQRARAPLIYIMNLMTKHGETDGFTASGHLAEIIRYGGRVPDAVLAHNGKVPANLALNYEAEESYPVRLDGDAVRQLGVRLIKVEDVMLKKSLVRHDPVRTSRALVSMFEELDPLRNSAKPATALTTNGKHV